MTCMRCGLPLPAGQETSRCPDCVSSSGALAPYEAVHQRVAAALVRTLGVDEAAATRAATDALASLPDWTRAAEVADPGPAWRLEIDVAADTVVIRGVKGLTTPRLERGGRRCILTPQAEGWLLQTAIAQRKGLAALVPDLDRSVEVHVPETIRQIDFKLEAGQLEITDVPARVVGALGVGQLLLKHVTGVDVEVGTGQVEVSGCFGAGEHRIWTRIGTLKVTLEAGSSLEVESKVHQGSLEITGMEDGFGRRSNLTRPVRCVVGEGEGQLDLQVRTGDLELSAPATAKMTPSR